MQITYCLWPVWLSSNNSNNHHFPANVSNPCFQGKKPLFNCSDTCFVRVLAMHGIDIWT